MNEKTNTPENIAAILAEMRGNEFDDPHLDADGIIGARRLARDWADRIEAAYKREHAAWHAETDAAKDARNRVACRMRSEFAAKCRNCPERAPVDAAAMREALERCNELFRCDDDNKSRLCILARKADEATQAALAAPARNCDVGTAQEQIDRFNEFCYSHRYYIDEFHGDDCRPDCPIGKIVDRDNKFCDNCWAAWAQMPYTPAEGGGHA